MEANLNPERIARARSGDASAFEALVEARVGPMTRTAMAILGREDEARDAIARLHATDRLAPLPNRLQARHAVSAEHPTATPEALLR